jgi:hypothetical protein
MSPRTVAAARRLRSQTSLARKPTRMLNMMTIAPKKGATTPRKLRTQGPSVAPNERRIKTTAEAL